MKPLKGSADICVFFGLDGRVAVGFSLCLPPSQSGLHHVFLAPHRRLHASQSQAQVVILWCVVELQNPKGLH